MRRCITMVLAVAMLGACGGGGDGDGGGERVLVGAASRSILPTSDGARGYLEAAPGWAEPVRPDDVGAFVAEFDEGKVDVGNGNSDAAWVHDDLRSTAVAIERAGRRVVLVSADVYMIFATDGREIERRARQLLPEDWADAEIVISATHNHHGPDTAFSINDDWYARMADETAAAVAAAVEAVEPAELSVASGQHHFGMYDARDPRILDPRLNVLLARRAGSDEVIATLVQWASHPETTLGWEPPVPPRRLRAWCATKGWIGDDCYAEGRYLTADYPGVLRERLRAELGGEVVYFNGALGSQIGPGGAQIWKVTDDAPLGDGVTAPAGALPVAGCADFSCRNMARTSEIGSQLAAAVLRLVGEAEPLAVTELDVRRRPFYTRLTNIGFRVLLADGTLGWQDAPLYRCEGEPADDTCTPDDSELVDDPLLTPLVDSQIRTGDVLSTELAHLDLGRVGFLFMPGELPPELVVGLPDDFSDTATYYEEPGLHAVGDAYRIPGSLLDLVDEDVTFTVGLGGDELGYWVPLPEVRLKCLDLVLGGTDQTCQSLYDAGFLVAPDAVGGPVCHDLDAGEPPVGATEPQVTALTAVCRYGQALGRELGEPDGHYEETNSAGWDLVDDTWAAARALFGVAP